MTLEWTPLHRSSRNGHINVVQYLVTHGADINAIDNSFNYHIICTHPFTMLQLMDTLSSLSTSNTDPLENPMIKFLTKLDMILSILNDEMT